MIKRKVKTLVLKDRKIYFFRYQDADFLLSVNGSNGLPIQHDKDGYFVYVKDRKIFLLDYEKIFC